MHAAKMGSQMITEKNTDSTQSPIENIRLPQSVRGRGDSGSGFSGPRTGTGIFGSSVEGEREFSLVGVMNIALERRPVLLSAYKLTMH